MITVRHLTKTFVQSDGKQSQVLKDVNCHIDKGEVISTIGPSGTGKSTFLRTLNLLEFPTSGEIIVNGKNILSKNYPLNKLREKMGMVFQSLNLFEHLSVLDNVTLAPIKLHGLSRSQAEQEGIEYLRKVGMAEKISAMPSQLSGGQKQRVAIARTLAMHPDIILFDEPTSVLDPTMVGEVQGVIQSLAQEKMTMLIVTHEMKFAREVSSRIFFMYDGTIHEDGTPEQIFINPKKTETRNFVHLIRKLIFDIENKDFDFYNMTSRIKQFCIRYSMPERMNPITHVVEEMLMLLSKYNNPIHIEITYSELDYSSKVVFVHKGENISPLDREDADELSVMIIRGMSKDIQTQQTNNGVQLTFLIE
ncbi:MAG: amino acid ABC transporter ATP-binding protein [Bacteroidales bacterium]|nr:amino acid ABC transporter ATP-binding protein [Bacteroidales bacterium]